MTYNKAPLPFQGQKKNFIKQFRELLKDEFSWHKDGIFIDAFGGSGLLSHNIKQTFPNARVIYNDFDGYSERLANIEQTNEILKEINPYYKKYSKNQRIDSADKNKMLSVIYKYESKGYFIDYLTLSSLLLFSGNYAKTKEEFLKNKSWYVNVSGRIPLYNANGYLSGVETISKDALKLLNEHKDTEAVLVLDPPYLQTRHDGYNSSWGLGEFLELSKSIKEPYIFFSSDTSDILSFMDFMTQNYDCEQFNNYKIKQASLAKWGRGTKANKTDYMIYKNKGGSLL